MSIFHTIGEAGGKCGRWVIGEGIAGSRAHTISGGRRTLITGGNPEIQIPEHLSITDAAIPRSHLSKSRPGAIPWRSSWHIVEKLVDKSTEIVKISCFIVVNTF